MSEPIRRLKMSIVGLEEELGLFDDKTPNLVMRAQIRSEIADLQRAVDWMRDRA